MTNMNMKYVLILLAVLSLGVISESANARSSFYFDFSFIENNFDCPFEDDYVVVERVRPRPCRYAHRRTHRHPYYRYVRPRYRPIYYYYPEPCYYYPASRDYYHHSYYDDYWYYY